MFVVVIFRRDKEFMVVDGNSNSSDESSQDEEARSGDGREYFLLIDNWYVPGLFICRYPRT